MQAKSGWGTLACAAIAVGLIVAPLLLRGRSVGAAQSANSSASRASSLAARPLNNLGIAYMEQQRPEDALKSFEQAAAPDSKSYIPRLNQGIALLNMQKSDD